MLVCLMYRRDGNGYEERKKPVVEIKGLAVFQDVGTWSFGRQRNNIGTGVRVPDDGIYSGPAVVYDDQDEEHLRFVEGLREEAKAGCMPVP